MTTAEKLAQVKSFLNITGTDLDAQLTVFLTFAKNEILSWLYSGKTPDDVTDVPARYESTQIMACVVGYGVSGAEGQLSHSENGISRAWKHEDMVAYVRSRVTAFVGVV